MISLRISFLSRCAFYVLAVAFLLIGHHTPVMAVSIAEGDGWTMELDGFVYYQWTFDDNELRRQTHLSYVSGESDNSITEMSWDATRIGLGMSRQNDDDLTKGRIEFDFHNGHQPRFRHAYISHQRGDWTVLAGQTWLLIGDNGPAVNNDDWLWMQGNVHDRLPQIRLSRNWDSHEFAVSLNQQPPSPLLIGESLGYSVSSPTLPWIQWRCKRTLDKGFLSLSGAAGVWQFEGPVLGDEEEDVTSWILRGDVDYDLSDVRLIAALWGSSAGGYGSAVTQVAYLDPDSKPQPVRAWGGFANFLFPLSTDIDVGLFSGIDDPEDRPDDVPLTYGRNLTFGGNMFWKPTPSLIYSLEVQFAETEFDRGLPETFQDLRILAAAKFKF